MAFQVLTSFIVLLIAVTLIALSIISLHSTPDLVREQVHEALKLKQDSQTIKLWKDVRGPIYNRFYFFNVTNGDAVQREGAKPIVIEVGPFTYRVRLLKRILRYNPNGTIAYRERKYWFFDRKLSSFDENTPLFTLNAPLALTLTLMQQARASAVRVLITLALDAASEGFFIKRTVKQLLFEGYPDVLTTFGPMINPEIPSTRGRFAYMYAKNGTDDGLFNVYSGVDDITKLNLIDNYDGSNSIKHWSTVYCNTLANSTNGQLRPPLNQNETIVKLFSSDVCRVFRLRYRKSLENKYGLSVRRYVLDPNTFRNYRDYPPNFCYLSDYSYPLNSAPAADGRRLPYPSGIMDLSKCRHGIPIFISQPHFLNGARYYLQSVGGLKPNYRRHAFWMDIDPLTGTTVNLSARLQVNIGINKLPGMIRYRFIPEIVFPIFWQEYTFETTAEMSSRIMDASVMPEKISSISFFVLLSLGIFFALVSLCICLIPSAAKTYSIEINGRSQPDLIKTTNFEDTQDTQDTNRILPDGRNHHRMFGGTDNPISVAP